MAFSVIPAEAGIQEHQGLLDPGACPPGRVRRGDGCRDSSGCQRFDGSLRSILDAFSSGSPGNRFPIGSLRVFHLPYPDHLLHTPYCILLTRSIAAAGLHWAHSSIMRVPAGGVNLKKSSLNFSSLMESPSLNRVKPPRRL